MASNDAPSNTPKDNLPFSMVKEELRLRCLIYSWRIAESICETKGLWRAGQRKIDSETLNYWQMEAYEVLNDYINNELAEKDAHVALSRMEYLPKIEPWMTLGSYDQIMKRLKKGKKHKFDDILPLVCPAELEVNEAQDDLRGLIVAMVTKEEIKSRRDAYESPDEEFTEEAAGEQETIDQYRTLWQTLVRKGDELAATLQVENQSAPRGGMPIVNDKERDSAEARGLSPLDSLIARERGDTQPQHLRVVLAGLKRYADLTDLRKFMKNKRERDIARRVVHDHILQGRSIDEVNLRATLGKTDHSYWYDRDTSGEAPRHRFAQWEASVIEWIGQERAKIRSDAE